MAVRRFIRRLAGIPFVSIGLVGINVVVYVANGIMNDRLLLQGNLNVFDILVEQEFARILWAMFLHADINHLFNNMIILLFMGAMLEKAAGHMAIGSIYILSGICGNICSLVYKLLHNGLSISIGASGAVFGMDGLLLALVFFSGRNLTTVTPSRVVVMTILSVYNGFTGANIDNAAHLGGLFAGFMLGCLYCAIQYVKTQHKSLRR